MISWVIFYIFRLLLLCLFRLDIYKLLILDNWNKFKSFIYISLFFNTTSSVKQFVVTVQIFVYKCLFTIVFFLEKGKKHSQNLSHFWKYSHFENESAFQITHWLGLCSHNESLKNVYILKKIKSLNQAWELGNLWPKTDEHSPSQYFS